MRDWVNKALKETVRGKLNEHIHIGPLTAYVRWTKRPDPTSREMLLMMEIGSVEVEEDKRGQGIFTEFLTIWQKIADEQQRQVMVECVHNTALQDMLTRRGYIQIEDNWWRPHILKD